MQHKSLGLSSVNLKFDGTNPRVFEGYASVFGGVDSYGDTILKGAYSETIKPESRRGRPIRMRWNHFGPVVGKFIDIYEDDIGLFVRGELTPGHSVAEDIAASMQHGAVDGLSIGYTIPEDGMEYDGVVRVLKRVNLIEISVVEEPADVSARVDSIKSILETAETMRDLEKCLRDVGGFSKTDAVALISRIKSIDRGERDYQKGDDIMAQIAKISKNLTRGK